MAIIHVTDELVAVIATLQETLPNNPVAEFLGHTKPGGTILLEETR